MKAFYRIPVYTLGAALLIGSAYLHQKGGGGALDFFAYYKAAMRLRAGEVFYVNESHYAFKYAPICVYYFLPFAWFSFDAARWIYASLHWMVGLSIPFLLARLLGTRDLFPALCLGFLASSRFIDGEFRASNCGLFMTAAILAGCLVLRSRLGFWGPWFMGLGSVVKIHSLVLFGAFAFWRDRRTLLCLALLALFLFLFPNPALWIDWWNQMKQTGGEGLFDPRVVELQGFYAVGSHVLSWAPATHRSLLLAAPFALAAFLLLPHFTLEEAGRRAPLFFLTVSAWVLWALMSSPLPWQHTYSCLWAFFPASWCLANRGERRLLVVLAILLGATPVDIVGKAFSTAFEGGQGIFLTVLAFWVLLVVQIRRLSLTKTTTEKD